MEKQNFPSEDGAVLIPLLALDFAKPVDGWPPRVQWERWAESIWSGSETNREPIEVRPVKVNPGDLLDPTSIAITKGFTRASLIAFAVIQTLLVEDQTKLEDSERDYFTQLLGFRLN